MAYVPNLILFAVVGAPSDSVLMQAIATAFPKDHISFGPGRWFIVTSGTAQELSDKLGISDGPSGPAVVIAASGYYGRASTQVWEWIAAKLGKPQNG